MTEMSLMAECAELNQALLPYRDFVKALDALARNWLADHEELPYWWSL
jgi:hypothetical protein